MANILLVEDMQGVRDSLEMILSMAGHNVTLAENGTVGIEKVSAGHYDLVISDILMPEIDGTELIIRSKTKNPDTPVLAISAGGDGVSADQALSVASQKADAILEKPFSKDELLQKVNELLES